MNSRRRAARNSRGRGLARCCEGEAMRRRRVDTLGEWYGKGRGGRGRGRGRRGREGGRAR